MGACQKFNWDSVSGKKDPKAGSETITPANQVQTPFLTPSAGAYNAAQNVAIASATSGANICYTVDGSAPACDASAACSAGVLFSADIPVAASQTLKAIACKATMTNSAVVQADYVIDAVVPVISGTTPAPGSTVTNTQVSYTLSENCGSGSITWTRTGGTADGASPHVMALVGGELAVGPHANITIANTPPLVANAIYDLAFNCTDPAGNVATPATVINVTFDNVAPVISSTGPANGSFVTNTQVSYTLSEACASASITWTRTAGNADGGSPHVRGLAAGELTLGAHNNITIASNPTLVSETVYDISFNCTDAAGNAATTVTNTSITYDTTIPVISSVSPASSATVNNTQVSYTLSENCNTANIMWTRTGGTADGSSPHNQALAAGELTAGAHNNITITNNPSLVSGAIYSIQFSCTDGAGNAATNITRTNVTFDSTGPVISAVAPASSAFVANTLMSFTFSEACASASITWTRTGGAADGSSPHVQALTAGELTLGAHNNITIANNPTLVSDAVYTLDFNCTDAASNAATTITVTNVTYDATAPVISGVSPTASTAVNTTQVSYTFSENCSTATITYTHTGGTASGNFNQSLIGSELTAGPHGPLTITNNPVLVSGAIYTLEFNCSDAANNAATAITRTNVTYDTTPPTVSISNLRANSQVQTGFMIGIAADNVALTDVRVSLDGGAYNVASGTTAWNFALPNGASTWPMNSAHTIDVRATDTAGNQTNTTQISVRKLSNQDINGDGYGDMAVNGYNYTTYTGRGYVFYGSASGITIGAAGSATTIITGEAINTYTGRSMTIADFNGDGYGDLALGGYGYNSLQGRVYVFYGSSGGITSANAAAAPRVINGAAAGDQFGSTVTAGNANNDGYEDLMVTATNHATNLGRAYAFYGGGGGIAGTTAAAANVTITGEAASTLGTGLALGDFNGDNNPDVAIGASTYATNTGRVYIFYGSAGTLVGGSAMTANAIATGENSGDYYGAAMAAGDINGDGITDLSIGAYAHTTSTGKLYLYHGVSSTGIPLSNGATPNVTFTGEATANAFTTSIVMRDFDADGFSDLLVGAWGYTSNAGRAYLFSGQAGTLSSGSASLAGLKIAGEAANSGFGRGTGASDVNGDGRPDILGGANLNATNQGKAYTFHSPQTGTITATAASSMITGEVGTTQFGIHISR